MDEIKLSLSQAGQAGELSIVRVDGVVDTITASELESLIENLLAQKRYKILIDLGGVEYISSAGWGIFVSKIQEIRHHDGDLKLTNMIPNVSEIYELLEFENIIQAFESLDSGKKAFNISSSGDSAGEKIWKASDRIVPEAGSAIQSVPHPSGRGISGSSFALGSAATTSADDNVILKLVIDDPFSTIRELCHQAKEAVPPRKMGWWKVFGILRRHHLLRLRSRFRYARRQTRR